MSKKNNDLLLDSDQLIVVQRDLAVIVGDREAIALQQIHYWCDINRRAGKREHFIDDQWWMYNTWNEWQKNNFPFWSLSTTRRVFDSLSAKGLIITRPHAERNKGNWFTINYGELENILKENRSTLKVRRLKSSEKGVQNEQTASVQNEQTSLSKMNRLSVQNEQPASDTENTEITSEAAAAKRARDPVPDASEESFADRPQAFALYEANIGMLTPLIRDDLLDLLKEFSAAWVEDAIREAVRSNVRKINYIASILKRWQREGKAPRVGANHANGKAPVSTGEAAALDALQARKAAAMAEEQRLAQMALAGGAP